LTAARGRAGPARPRVKDPAPSVLGPMPEVFRAYYRNVRAARRSPPRFHAAMSSTILVVEDEPAIQELIAVNLSFAGHKVLRAFDAEQAQTLIRAELPDLILLDWMLPGDRKSTRLNS